jgi:hypothetical protein
MKAPSDDMAHSFAAVNVKIINCNNSTSQERICTVLVSAEHSSFPRPDILNAVTSTYQNSSVDSD